MQKGNKSTLGNILKTKSPIHSELPDDACFVLDGGHLLHVVPWPADGTYRDVCLTYISYVQHHYGQNTTVVFDGYSNMHSTKIAEQRRRAALTPSANIIFELDMKANTPKKSFLANNNNKARLIDKLMLELQHIGINCKQHESDADHLIISTAMEIAGLNPNLLWSWAQILTFWPCWWHSVCPTWTYSCYSNIVQQLCTTYMKYRKPMINWRHICWQHTLLPVVTPSQPHAWGERRKPWKFYLAINTPTWTHSPITIAPIWKSKKLVRPFSWSYTDLANNLTWTQLDTSCTIGLSANPPSRPASN